MFKVRRIIAEDTNLNILKNFRGDIVLKFCKNLVFISIEDHIIMSTTGKVFLPIEIIYLFVKYLQHFHLIEINKRRQRHLENSLSIYNRCELKFLIFFKIIEDAIKIK